LQEINWISEAILYLTLQSKLETKIGYPGMVDADMEVAGFDSIGGGTKILKEKFATWHQWSTGV